MIDLNAFKEPFTDAIKTSVGEAFSTLLSLSPQLTDKDVSSAHAEGVICSIGFTGNVEGSVAINVTGTVACKLVSKMLGTEITELSKDVTDGVGELLNMIAGGAKNRLAALVPDFEISLPTAIRGQDLEMAMSAGTTAIHQGFECGDISFVIMAFYKPHKDEGTSKPAAAVPAKDAKQLLNDLIGAKEQKTVAAAEPPKAKADSTGQDAKNLLSSLINAKEQEGAAAASSEKSASSRPAETATPAAAGEAKAGEDEFLADVMAAVNAPSPIGEPPAPPQETRAASALNALLKDIEAPPAAVPPQAVNPDAVSKARIQEIFKQIMEHPDDPLSREELEFYLSSILPSKRPAASGSSPAVAAPPESGLLVTAAMKELDQMLKQIQTGQ